MSVILLPMTRPPPWVPVLPGRLFAVAIGNDGSPVGRAGSDSRVVLPGIAGLRYTPDFLDSGEEATLVEQIDRNPWNGEMQRRVQHYGFRYDYRTRQTPASERARPLPGWARDVARRLCESEFLPEMPDQLIVNEYRGDQGIGRHRDSLCFADGIATVSLLESWEMVFRRLDGREAARTLRLERGSVAILTGESRYDWTHEIPKRWSEPSAAGPGGRRGGRTPRGRRLSLTFRRVLPAGVEFGSQPRPRRSLPLEGRVPR